MGHKIFKKIACRLADGTLAKGRNDLALIRIQATAPNIDVGGRGTGMPHQYLRSVQANGLEHNSGRLMTDGMEAERLHTGLPAEPFHEAYALRERKAEAGIGMCLHEHVVDLTGPRSVPPEQRFQEFRSISYQSTRSRPSLPLWSISRILPSGFNLR